MASNITTFCLSKIALALVFSLKISVNPESILTSCFNDRLITKGTMLEVLTIFLKVGCASIAASKR